MAAILLIDHDGAHLELLRSGLVIHGHVVMTASDAEGGVQLLREGGIDVVIVHHKEAALTSTLVAGLERLPDPPPFVMVSSAVDGPSLSARIGAAEFVTSPCVADDLLPILDRLASRRAIPGEFEEIPTRPNDRDRGRS